MKLLYIVCLIYLLEPVFGRLKIFSFLKLLKFYILISSRRQQSYAAIGHAEIPGQQRGRRPVNSTSTQPEGCTSSTTKQ